MTIDRPLRVVAVLEHRADGCTALVRRTADPDLVGAVEALLDAVEPPPSVGGNPLHRGEEPHPAA